MSNSSERCSLRGQLANSGRTGAYATSQHNKSALAQERVSQTNSHRRSSRCSKSSRAPKKNSEIQDSSARSLGSGFRLRRSYPSQSERACSPRRGTSPCRSRANLIRSGKRPSCRACHNHGLLEPRLRVHSPLFFKRLTSIGNFRIQPAPSARSHRSRNESIRMPWQPLLGAGTNSAQIRSRLDS